MKPQILIPALILYSLTSASCFAIDDVLTEKVIEVLKEVAMIKPGNTRADLQQHFTTEGGLSAASRRTYVSRRCPYIKIDVTFNSPAHDSPTDTIEKLSKPYLEYATVD